MLDQRNAETGERHPLSTQDTAAAAGVEIYKVYTLLTIWLWSQDIGRSRRLEKQTRRESPRLRISNGALCLSSKNITLMTCRMSSARPSSRLWGRPDDRPPADLPPECKRAVLENFCISISECLLHATWPGGGIGRRWGLKIPCPPGRVGSNPTRASV